MRFVWYLMLDGIPKLWLINKTINNWLVISFPFKGSKNPIPNDQDSSIVFVQAISIWAWKYLRWWLILARIWFELRFQFSYHGELCDVWQCSKYTPGVLDLWQFQYESKIDRANWIGCELSCGLVEQKMPWEDKKAENVFDLDFLKN